MESGIERRILGLNGRVDTLLKKTWAKEWPYPVARRYLARAQSAWIAWVAAAAPAMVV